MHACMCTDVSTRDFWQHQVHVITTCWQQQVHVIATTDMFHSTLQPSTKLNLPRHHTISPRPKLKVVSSRGGGLFFPSGVLYVVNIESGGRGFKTREIKFRRRGMVEKSSCQTICNTLRYHSSHRHQCSYCIGLFEYERSI